MVNTATLLSDERVLVTGLACSRDGSSCATSAEVYDPEANNWRLAAPFPPELGSGSTAPVALPDGKVLFTGGFNVPSTPSSFHTLNSALIYEPSTDIWTPVAPMPTSRFQHTATLLRDGTVLVVGGVSGSGERPLATGSAELFNIKTNTWSQAGTLRYPRAQHAAIMLTDGRVLVVGGYDPLANSAVAEAELYDPGTRTWSSAGSLLTPRASPAAILVDGDKVLVAGGTSQVGPLSSVELFDPATMTWKAAAPMRITRYGYALIPLAGGVALAAGGMTRPNDASSATAATEIYDPSLDQWAGAAPMTAARYSPLFTLLGVSRKYGGVLVMSQLKPFSGGEAPSTATAEIYTGRGQGQAEACFPETGKCMSGPFLAYWEVHGGLAINGYPISDEFVQVLEDGKAYQVQFFERVRMEYHPENSPPYDVLLGQFGRRIHRADPPVAPQPGASYFKETGHNVNGSFLAYWQTNGGLMQFGYPISEEISEELEDCNIYVVQYFERARFEHHPENHPPYDVLLGQFGRRIIGEQPIR